MSSLSTCSMFVACDTEMVEIKPAGTENGAGTTCSPGEGGNVAGGAMRGWRTGDSPDVTLNGGWGVKDREGDGRIRGRIIRGLRLPSSSSSPAISTDLVLGDCACNPSDPDGDPE